MINSAKQSTSRLAETWIASSPSLSSGRSERAGPVGSSQGRSTFGDVLRDDRKIILPRPRIDRLLQDRPDQLRPTQPDAAFPRQFERVGQILQRIFGRERALRKYAGHDCLQAMVAQRKAVRRALR